MALQGTLEDFGIADIFQLIGQQQKTGMLVLTQKNKGVNIYFREGCIVSAEMSNRDQNELLGQMMVQARLIQQDQLIKALDLQKKTLQKVGTILLENQFIQKSELDEFIYLQTKETIFKLFRWKNGTYQFHQQDVSLTAEFFQPISAEHILMDGFRIIDEWPSIRKQIPSFDLVFERVPGKEVVLSKESKEEGGEIDQAFAAFEGASPETKSAEGLSPSVQRVYELIDDRRNVQDLIAQSRLGEFETCHALVTLQSQGLICLSLHKEIDSPEETKSKRMIDLYQDYDVPSRQFLASFYHLGPFLGFFLLVILFISQMELGPFHDLFPSSRRKIERHIIHNLISEYQLQKLKIACEVYALRRGLPPASLEILVQEGTLGPADLSYPWKVPYVYTVFGDQFILEKPL